MKQGKNRKCCKSTSFVSLVIIMFVSVWLFFCSLVGLDVVDGGGGGGGDGVCVFVCLSLSVWISTPSRYSQKSIDMEKVVKQDC